MVLTPFDMVVLGLVLVFGTIGLLRGAIREIVNFVSHIAAIIISFRFQPQVYNSLKNVFPPGYQGVGKVACFILVYILVLVVFFIAEKIIRAIIEKLRLGFVDRLFGFLIGAAKGFVIAVVLFIILITFIPNMEKKLNKCITYPYLKKGSEIIIQLSPKKFRDTFMNRAFLKAIQEKI